MLILPNFDCQGLQISHFILSHQKSLWNNPLIKIFVSSNKKTVFFKCHFLLNILPFFLDAFEKLADTYMKAWNIYRFSADLAPKLSGAIMLFQHFPQETIKTVFFSFFITKVSLNMKCVFPALLNFCFPFICHSFVEYSGKFSHLSIN